SGVTTGSITAIFRADKDAAHASTRRRRSAEEEDRARDRGKFDAALGRRTQRTDRASQGGDRAAGSRHQDQAGLKIRRGFVLQEVTDAFRVKPALTMFFVRPDLKAALSFLLHYSYPSIFMDIEWLLSTLFDASLLSPSSRRQRRLLFCSVS